MVTGLHKFNAINKETVQAINIASKSVSLCPRIVYAKYRNIAMSLMDVARYWWTKSHKVPLPREQQQEDLFLDNNDLEREWHLILSKRIHTI